MAPSSLLLFLLASASAGLAHLIWGRRWLQLPIFWMAAFAGALIVFTIGVRLPVALPVAADVAVVEVLLGAWIVLLVASRLRL